MHIMYQYSTFYHVTSFSCRVQVFRNLLSRESSPRLPAEHWRRVLSRCLKVQLTHLCYKVVVGVDDWTNVAWHQLQHSAIHTRMVVIVSTRRPTEYSSMFHTHVPISATEVLPSQDRVCGTVYWILYIGWPWRNFDASWLSPSSCGYDMVWCVELRGEDLSCYLNNIRSVGLWKCLYDR